MAPGGALPGKTAVESMPGVVRHLANQHTASDLSSACVWVLPQQVG